MRDPRSDAGTSPATASDDARSREEDLEECFRGRKLWGDDFDLRGIRKWLDDEREASVEVRGGERYPYPDHALNVRYGFRLLPDTRFASVLGLGSAYGDEFEPVLDRVDHITIIEPSGAFVRKEIHGVPATYLRPEPDGTLPFPDHVFDLTTSFGVLHHIPNVTSVVREVYRCLRPGGHFLVREPIVSMGDWRFPRPGLTKRERGLPLAVFRGILSRAGFAVVGERRCQSPILSKLSAWLDRPVYRWEPMVALDAAICRLLPRTTTYHPRTFVEKLAPMSVFLVLRKPMPSSRAEGSPEVSRPIQENDP